MNTHSSSRLGGGEDHDQRVDLWALGRSVSLRLEIIHGMIHGIYLGKV